MTDTGHLLRLMSWLSPVFPTGGFAYSSGLEAAVQTALVTDEQTLHDWLLSAIEHGSLHNDAIVFAAAWRAWQDQEKLDEICALGLALAGSAERYLEMTAQADAFKVAVKNWPESADVYVPEPAPLCAAVGIAAGASQIDLTDALTAYCHSVVSNQVQAAIRLSVTGQTGAARILAKLEPRIVHLVGRACLSDLDDLGSATINADIMAMKHEHLAGRMFRS